MNRKCKHKNTIIWEPHLAGARKCIDCGWIYNPNRSYVGKESWFDEESEIKEEEIIQYKKLRKKYSPIYKFIGKFYEQKKTK